MPRDPSPEREIFTITDDFDFDQEMDFEPIPYKKPGRIARLCSYISTKFKKPKYVKYIDGL